MPRKAMIVDLALRSCAAGRLPLLVQLLTFTITVTYLGTILDDTPHFIFGDSKDYLQTSYPTFLPTDRSWLYGLVVNWLMNISGSFSSVILVQQLLLGVSLVALGYTIAARTGRPWMGYLICTLAIIEPLNFFYVRHIMTDVPAASFFLLTLIAFNRLVCAERPSLMGLAGNVAVLFASALATTALRVAYVPSLLVLMIAPVIYILPRILLSSYLAGLLLLRRPMLASAAVGSAIAALIIINKLVNPSMGFTLNVRSSDFFLGVISPALRYKVLIQQGLDIDRAVYESFHLEDGDRIFQLWDPAGLIAALYNQMPGLTPQERQKKFADLNWATLADNPAGVARVFFDNFIIAVNPAEYISGLRQGWFVGAPIFDAGFVETFINPRVWQQIQPDMPRKSTLSLVYFNHSGILIWLYFVSALVAPLGVRFVQRKYLNLFALWSVVASVYACSTILFSHLLVPRYYCVLPPLVIALFMLLLDALLIWTGSSKVGAAGGERQ
jgi:hypothetical protein